MKYAKNTLRTWRRGEGGSGGESMTGERTGMMVEIFRRDKENGQPTAVLFYISKILVHFWTLRRRWLEEER